MVLLAAEVELLPVDSLKNNKDASSQTKNDYNYDDSPSQTDVTQRILGIFK